MATKLDSETRMREYDKKLQLKHFKYYVVVQHEDGSFFHFNSAFIKVDPKDKGKIWVFTEHCGCFMFYTSDLSSYDEFIRKD